MITISLGIGGILFLLYLIIEFLFIRYQKRSFLLSLIPYIIMIRMVNKELPLGWRVYKVLFNFFNIYVSNKKYAGIVEVKSKIIEKIPLDVTYYEFVCFNWCGKIIRDDRHYGDGLRSLIIYTERENNRFPDLIRDQKLKDLGI